MKALANFVKAFFIYCIMKQLGFIILICCINVNSIFAANLDSLSSLIAQEDNPSKKIKHSIKLANEYLTVDLNKSDSILEGALLLAKANQKLNSIIKINIQLGTVQLEKATISRL